MHNNQYNKKFQYTLPIDSNISAYYYIVINLSPTNNDNKITCCYFKGEFELGKFEFDVIKSAETNDYLVPVGCQLNWVKFKADKLTIEIRDNCDDLIKDVKLVKTK